MGIKLLQSLKGGEVLKEDVILENDIMIPAGTIIKSEYIDLMKTLGIELVEIQDEKNEQKHPIFEEKEKEEYVKKLRKILENHIYQKQNSLKEVKELAKEIVENRNYLETELFDYEERKADLYEHTIMTTGLCIIIAKQLQMSLNNQIELAIGSLLHDIGLRYITVNYMNQSLEEKTDTELFEFKKHTILGFSALEKEDWIPKGAKMMVLSHHEKINGTGYPLKQKNKEIACQIIQVCDTFDCMISGMECKRQSVNAALDYLSEQSGELFEENIVNHLCKMIKRKDNT